MFSVSEIGDWNDPSTRLLDDSVVRTFGIGFDKLRRIHAERRTLEVGMSLQGGMVKLLVKPLPEERIPAKRVAKPGRPPSSGAAGTGPGVEGAAR